MVCVSGCQKAEILLEESKDLQLYMLQYKARLAWTESEASQLLQRQDLIRFALAEKDFELSATSAGYFAAPSLIPRNTGRLCSSGICH